jgi:fatty-acyl-CoA synthase
MHAAAIGEPNRDKGEMPVAYVQLRSEMSTSESELLAHCQNEITERAAVPRCIRIIEAMPLTAVGKIFKPALRLDAVQRCVTETAATLGCDADVRIEVCEVGGALVVVLRVLKTSGFAYLDSLRGELERYALRVEVKAHS